MSKNGQAPFFFPGNPEPASDQAWGVAQAPKCLDKHPFTQASLVCEGEWEVRALVKRPPLPRT